MPGEAVVHVVDDDVAVRQSLSFLLASHGLSVRLHESASAFLADMASAPAGCVVADVRMPGIDGIEFLRRLKAKGWAVPVIVMTGHADVPLAVEAMKAGAVDFIEKPFDDEIFVAAVRSALSRQTARVTRSARDSEFKARRASLSERESQVLAALVEGKANKAIAQDLGISPRTVEIYRANVMAKMEARTFAELVRMALAVDAADS